MCFITYKIDLLNNLNASPQEMNPTLITYMSPSIILGKKSMSIEELIKDVIDVNGYVE